MIALKIKGSEIMKQFIITSLKAIIFFLGWAICTAFGTIPSDNPAIWRLGAETLPLLYILVFSIIFWLIEKRNIEIIRFREPIRNISLGISVGAVWLGCTVAIMCLTGTLSFSGSNPISNLAVWLFACFLNVIMQELLVRGYIYQLVKSKYNVAASIIVTTILFTALHGGAFEAGTVAVLNVMTMSVFISLVLEYTDSLIAPILIHTVWNSVGAIVLGGVSLADDYPHLLNVVFHGNKLLSGGSCKMEGSIIVLILNVLFAILFFFLLKRQKIHTAK